MISEGVHSHGYGEVLQVVEELAEGFELCEADAALFHVQEPVQEGVVLVRVQVGVAEENLCEVYFRNGVVSWQALANM